jgi:hypothetical protein
MYLDTETRGKLLGQRTINSEQLTKEEGKQGDLLEK